MSFLSLFLMKATLLLIEKLNAKRFFKNILKTSKNWTKKKFLKCF